MPTYRTGPVVRVLSERPGFQRVLVRIDGVDQRAYNLTQLTGDVALGDDVVCNTTAVGLGLGTGGWHVVHWNLSRRRADVPGAGHIMKLRYSSLQVDTGAAEEQMPDEPVGLAGLPVVLCSLHSQVAIAAAAFAVAAPGRRLAYVMTDGAALPLALSELVDQLRVRALLAGTVTGGHAFGGDYEAVNVISALVVARARLRADAVIVGMGPGVVGTGSPLGHTAIELAGIADTTLRLGGRPIFALRASEADQRDRHLGLSHHTSTVLGLCRGATLAVPVGDETLAGIALIEGHARVSVAVPDVAAMLDRVGLVVTTMGRGPGDDPLFFRFAAAAGLVAAHLVGPRTAAPDSEGAG